MFAAALTAALALAATYYCAPTACVGNGTEASPWSLPQCLDASNGAGAGDTLRFAAGVYDCSGQCTFAHDGATYLADAGAVLEDTRSGEGEGANQTVQVWCDDCTLDGFAVRNLNWTPTTETPLAVEVHSQGVWLHRLSISNTHGGIFTASNARTVISETTIRDVGATLGGVGRGHGLYLQGATNAEAVHIEGAAGYGVQLWSSANIADVTLQQVSTRGSGRGGVVIGGAGAHSNIRILRSAFVSRPPYSHEGVQLLSSDVELTIADSLLMGGLSFGSPSHAGAQLSLHGNVLYGGPAWPGVQVPAWVFGSWTPATVCEPGNYCALQCAHPSNRWLQRGANCSCGC